MNYRHAYHAGNHADVLKHAVLARLIEHMKKKDKPLGERWKRSHHWRTGDAAA